MTSSLNKMKKCCNLKTCVVEGNGYFVENVVKKKSRAAQAETESFIRLLKHTHHYSVGMYLLNTSYTLPYSP